MKYTDDGLYNCTAETYIILLTKVTAINSIRKLINFKNGNSPGLCGSVGWASSGKAKGHQFGLGQAICLGCGPVPQVQERTNGYFFLTLMFLFLLLPFSGINKRKNINGQKKNIHTVKHLGTAPEGGQPLHTVKPYLQPDRPPFYECKEENREMPQFTWQIVLFHDLSHPYMATSSFSVGLSPSS